MIPSTTTPGTRVRRVLDGREGTVVHVERIEAVSGFPAHYVAKVDLGRGVDDNGLDDHWYGSLAAWELADDSAQPVEDTSDAAIRHRLGNPVPFTDSTDVPDETDDGDPDRTRDLDGEPIESAYDPIAQAIGARAQRLERGTIKPSPLLTPVTTGADVLRRHHARGHAGLARDCTRERCLADWRALGEHNARQRELRESRERDAQHWTALAHDMDEARQTGRSPAEIAHDREHNASTRHLEQLERVSAVARGVVVERFERLGATRDQAERWASDPGLVAAARRADPERAHDAEQADLSAALAATYPESLDVGSPASRFILVSDGRSYPLTLRELCHETRYSLADGAALSPLYAIDPRDDTLHPVVVRETGHRDPDGSMPYVVLDAVHPGPYADVHGGLRRVWGRFHTTTDSTD